VRRLRSITNLESNLRPRFVFDFDVFSQEPKANGQKPICGFGVAVAVALLLLLCCGCVAFAFAFAFDFDFDFDFANY